MADLLIRNAWCVATMDGQRRELNGGWVAITNGFVEALGSSADPAPWAAEVVDASVVGACVVEGSVVAGAAVAVEVGGDDIVVRIRADGGNGSRIDIRSKSRVGQSDLGINARRIRDFAARLKAEN